VTSPADLVFRGRPMPQLQHGRFDVYRRTDNRFIVYDPMLPFASRTASGPYATQGEAIDAAKALSAQADARGEPNAHERKGYAWDWSDPKTWER
jgi:hypothetical protein